MDYLPLFFSLRDTPVLLVGGGRVALRKARLLAAAGANIRLVAPTVEPELEALLARGGGEWIRADWQPAQLDGVRLAVIATPQEQVNAEAAAAARQRNIPVNVVDNPALCSFIFPALVERSPLLIAIGSSAQSPLLSRMLRGKIEALIPPTYGRLAAFAGRFRTAVKRVTPAPEQRRRFWEQLINGPVGALVLAGREAEADSWMQRYLARPAEHGQSRPPGAVYLIGAGPGDPDLLSFKALRLLQAADVVLHDRLVTPQILALARRDAERMDVGKRRAAHQLPQAEINQLLLELAQAGKCVARLKGGDPFVFGRGGEEIELLAAHGIPFQVVPGITAASGCACYAGIPLTHRDYAQSVRFVTAQRQDSQLDLPWSELQGERETLVFYMGLRGLPTICRELQAHGRAPDTPIALIEQGTTSQQRTLTGTLATMEAVVAAQTVHAPTVIIVGEVVRLHQRLRWFGESAQPGKWPPPPE